MHVGGRGTVTRPITESLGHYRERGTAEQALEYGLIDRVLDSH
jgi:ATP-dependent protease ClpP protease subunit